MAFRITARTLLELGAELISSDAIALYELIKNSVDAGSPIVRIKVQSVLSHSDYQEALEDLDENVPLDVVRENIYNAIAADAAVEAKKGFRSSIKNPNFTQDELRDALVKSYFEYNFIEVSDDGEGMSLEDLREVYLTVGTRSRRKIKSSWGANENHRILLGDKGVGRLSVMRLGDRLDVITSKAGEAKWNLLNIDWRKFSHDSDALLHEIHIEPKLSRIKKDKGISGTTIRITNLKSDWSRERFGKLLDTEFVRMIDPFERWRANKLFRIFYNGQQVTLTKMEKRLFEFAHAKVNFKFYYDEASGQPKITGDMHYRLHADKKKTISLNEAELVSISGLNKTALRNLGPLKVEFLWFNRIYLTAIEGIGKKSDVTALVKKWSGGLMVFRDGFRINPYGGPDDDWLHLDKKAFGQRGYKLNRHQVIGRVQLSWRNKFLTEQTNREGLVDNKYKEALIRILQWGLKDFKVFSQNIEDNLKREELTSLETLKKRVFDAKKDVNKRIRQIAVQVPEQAGPLQEVERLVNKLATNIEYADKIIDDYKSERGKFVHLASLGLMVELILHELGRASHNTIGTLDSIDIKALPGKLPAIFETLETQLKTLQKRIETLDPLGTARRQVKELFSVEEVVNQVVEARSAQAKRHKVFVRIESEGNRKWRIKAVKGMLIQIVENLLANSFYWLKQQSIVQANFEPQITIHLDQDTNLIMVSDNGPGVDPARAEEIFLPFVSSKPPGKGSGLGLYIAREIAEYHKWTLDISREPDGPDGTSLNTFTLDLNGGAK